MHDVIIVSIPLIAILAGILFNRLDVSTMRAEIRDLRAEMLARFDGMDARLDRVDADLRTFHFITGKLEGRMDSFEKRS